MNKRTGSLWATLLLAATTFVSAAQVRAVSQFDLPAQPLADALKAVADQTHINVLFDRRQIAQLRAPALKAQLTIDQALSALLAGSGFTHQFLSERTVVLATVGEDRAGQVRAGAADVRLVEQTPASVPAVQSRSEAAQGGDGDSSGLSEVVVTGTNIRGLTNTPSPMFVFSRDDIDRSGYATVQQFIQSLPQNFGGGQTESLARNSSGVDSATHGTSINLRNLGVGSTLTLVNGRRLAPSGLNGEYIDISMIPVTAVDHIDVLTDGASAIYGSDAVAGVVNFTLRDDYEGAQTRVRYGSPGSGPSDEYQFGQALGKAWGSGHVLANYEYYRRRPLDSEDRKYTADALDPYYLLPNQELNSLFVAGSQHLTARSELYGHLAASRRQSDSFASNAGYPAGLTSDNRQYGATLGARIDMNAKWQADVAATHDRATTDALASYPTFAIQSPANVKSTVTSGDFKADGPMFHIPGGAVSLAAGAQYRSENYAYNVSERGRRDVFAAFTEVSVPLVGRNNRRPGIERLTLTGAVRYEDYSDFGETTNPKFGILWSPVEGLGLRATYGTSFKVPTFDDIRDDGLATVASLADPRGGRTPTFLLANSYSQLQPEEATMRTAGLDIHPRALPGLTFQVTYFGIDYTQRIGRAFSSFAALLTDGDAGYGGALFTRNPTLAFIQNAIAGSSFSGVSAPAQAILNGTTPVTAVGAFADFRLHNLAGVQMEGLDFNVGYGFEAGIGRIDLQLGGQYMLRDDRRVSDTAPVNEVVNKPYNTVDVRLRNSLNWVRGPWGATVFLNHLDSYTNTIVAPGEPVSSWTTVDMTLRYDTQGRFAGSWLDNTVFSLNSINLFDKDPPFLRNPTNRLNFDGANATPLGRLVALQMTKSWGTR